MVLSSRGKKVLALGSGVAVLAAVAFFLLGGRDAVGEIPIVGDLVEPAVCPLTGLEPAREAMVERPAVAVKIENSSIAYPLKGLDRAEIVYEELVEGGITRFLAMYHCTDAELAGPIRSARVVDPAIMTPTTYILAFSGANQHVLNRLDEAGIVQIEENNAGEAMQRIETGDSFEHTLFADTAALRRIGRKEYSESPPGDVYVFGDMPDVRSRRARQIEISFSPMTEVSYTYDSGRYYRYQAGEPFMADTGEQIAVDNVLIEAHAVNLSGPRDVVGTAGVEIEDVTGSGLAVLFRDGRAIRGRWIREAIEDPVVFETKDGERMVLKPGTTWIHLVPNDKGEVKGSFEFAR
ncbi:MAG: DUF3048 domain-containing protein [Actinomycetota bacterium]|nr:DUF3048 domain-containing protein [Actinomycetota bacterium]